MRIISLISGLMLLTLTTLKAETTSNLVSQDFTTGWSGTNINSTHGNNTIAGIDGKYVESDAVSLNEVGINKESLNEGFSVVGSAEAWFWNSTEQSVTSTIKATNDNGYTSTQIRTWEGSCNTYNGCGFESDTDTLIIGKNSSQDYDVSLRFDFEESSNRTTHWAADIKNPSIVVNYNYVPPLDQDIQDEIIEIFEDLEDNFDSFELIDDGFEVVNIIETEQFDTEIFEELVLDNFDTNEITEEPMVMTEEVFEESNVIEEKPEQMAEQITEETTEEMPNEIVEQKEEVTEQPKEEIAEETQEEIIEEETQEVATESKEEEPKEEVEEEEPKEKVKTKVATKTNKKPKIDKIMAKVDAQVKDHAKNLVIKNIIKLDAMQSDQASLLEYNNTEFYKPKDIYLNQIEIFDNRSIYKNVDLVQYIDNDIMEIKIKKLNEIKYKKRILLLELKELKNG